MVRFFGASGQRHSEELNQSRPFPTPTPRRHRNGKWTRIRPVSLLHLPVAPSHTGHSVPTLTGHIEHAGPLRAQTSPGDGKPTAEVGAMVLRVGGEQNL